MAGRGGRYHLRDPDEQSQEVPLQVVAVHELKEKEEPQLPDEEQRVVEWICYCYPQDGRRGEAIHLSWNSKKIIEKKRYKWS